MPFHVICSTADGNLTKEFSNWEDAHTYANEWMDGFTHWNHRHFNNVETSKYANLWKTRNGETVKIQEIKSDDCPNCADQASIAAPGETVLCKTHEKTREYLDDDTSHLSQWSAKLEEIRESSLDDLGFLESLKKAFTNDEFCALNDHDQRLVVQAWLYPTIDDDVEEENVEQWYLENAHRMEFHSFAPYCSICGLESHYVGVTTGGTPFEFCKSCRDKLVRYKVTLEPQKERIDT